jgi:threonine/homoserine/homoserine lactone efflux protein
MIDATLATYTGFTLVFAATPGQSTAVVIQQTVDNGWRAGFSAAVGCAIANIFHATGTRVGLGLLVGYWPGALAAVRFGGAAYLFWLGGKSVWRAVRPPAALPAAASAIGRVAFRQGLVTNLLNPSIVTFYLAVVPTFLRPVDPPSRYVVLAVIHVSLAFACHNTWAGLFNQLGHLLRSVRARRVFDAIAGLALGWLGARVAFPG